jgi:hypothetical protein
LPHDKEAVAPEKPFYLYIDVIATKSDVIIGQTSDYVEVALTKLMSSLLIQRDQNGYSLVRWLR